MKRLAISFTQAHASAEESPLHRSCCSFQVHLVLVHCPECRLRSISEYRRLAKQMVGCHPVTDLIRAGGIAANHSSNHGPGCRGWIGTEVYSALSRLPVQRFEDDPRLDDSLLRLAIQTCDLMEIP